MNDRYKDGMNVRRKVLGDAQVDRAEANKLNGSYRFDIHLQGPVETIFFDM